eukprot:CAMPEP_0178951710 /NCGR_PEP_ID=MMETSP0789-20121207/7384_1 /TAXON_ID=3005 /ORGANISM="Rhizosolenia setigera, Strain CCMP 1694" /LENGTH=568 /DNA_ID=CAMNT_0020632627 /DNA_START=1143 /DNA_END=2849 /DNA_ORIENTATION=+
MTTLATLPSTSKSSRDIVPTTHNSNHRILESHPVHQVVVSPATISGIRMTSTELVKQALEHDGYETPELNDVLYLHFKGYPRIEDTIRAYTNLKCLWLESNGLTQIENLDNMLHLRCLYLQKNLLTSIGSSLQGLQNLVQLDLSENRIETLEGLDTLQNLTSLNMAKNLLSSEDSIMHLTDCPALTTLDLSHNQLITLDDDDDLDGKLLEKKKDESLLTSLIENVFAKLSNRLVNLNMKGNPIVPSSPFFRKRMILALEKLRYFNEYPVFDVERASVDAWNVGGHEKELEVKKEWQIKKREEERKGLDDFRQWQAEIRAKKKRELEEESKSSNGDENPQQQKEREKMEIQKKERLRRAAEEGERERQLYALKDKDMTSNSSVRNPKDSQDPDRNFEADCTDADKVEKAHCDIVEERDGHEFSQDTNTTTPVSLDDRNVEKVACAKTDFFESTEPNTICEKQTQTSLDREEETTNRSCDEDNSPPFLSEVEYQEHLCCDKSITVLPEEKEDKLVQQHQHEQESVIISCNKEDILKTITSSSQMNFEDFERSALSKRNIAFRAPTDLPDM